MSFYTKVRIGVSLLLALIISLSVYNYLQSIKVEVTVVIAQQDIPERTWIKPEMLKEVRVGVQERDVLAPNALSAIHETDVMVAKTRIAKGQVINVKQDIIVGTKQSLIQNKVLLENGDINQSYFIADNKRIITVRADSQGALAYKLNTGDYVDVIFTTANDKTGSFSMTILQHIRIFDVEKGKEKSSDALQNISLVVSPQQAVDLAFAKRIGRIDFILNPLEGDSEVVYPVSINKFLEPFQQNDGVKK